MKNIKGLGPILIVAIFLVVLGLGAFEYSKRDSTADEDILWNTFNGSGLSHGLSFSYPKKLDPIETRGSNVTLHHSIPYENSGDCDMVGEGKKYPTLTDFEVSFNLVNGPVTLPYVDGKFETDTLKGSFAYEGAEGCGYIKYVFPLDEQYTLVVNRAAVQALSGISTVWNRDEILAVPGVISKEESDILFRKIMESVRFEIEKETVEPKTFIDDESGIQLMYPGEYVSFGKGAYVKYYNQDYVELVKIWDGEEGIHRSTFYLYRDAGIEDVNEQSCLMSPDGKMITETKIINGEKLYVHQHHVSDAAMGGVRGLQNDYRIFRNGHCYVFRSELVWYVAGYAGYINTGVYNAKPGEQEAQKNAIEKHTKMLDSIFSSITFLPVPQKSSVIRKNYQDDDFGFQLTYPGDWFVSGNKLVGETSASRVFCPAELYDERDSECKWTSIDGHMLNSLAPIYLRYFPIGEIDMIQSPVREYFVDPQGKYVFVLEYNDPKYENVFNSMVKSFTFLEGEKETIAEGALRSIQQDLGTKIPLVRDTMNIYIPDKNATYLFAGYRLYLTDVSFEKAISILDRIYGGNQSPTLVTELGSGYQSANLACIYRGRRASSSSTELPYISCFNLQ